MKKNIGVTLRFFIYCTMFTCGFIVCSLCYPEKENRIKTFVQQRKYTEDTMPVLTGAETAFMEEHVFGQWKFAERCISLDEGKHGEGNYLSNISDVGVEELMEQGVFGFYETSIAFNIEMDQFSFSNAADMYLLGLNRGYQTVKNPIYKIEEMKDSTVKLEDVYNKKGREVQMPSMDNFIKVMYFTEMEGKGNAEWLAERNFGDTIYIDPNEKDIFYIDFCGLWRMERDETNYSTGVKSFR